ncbi:MAG: PhoH family protein [Bacteroides sp.]
MIRFYDTSTLLNLQETAFKHPFITSSIVLNELEHIKTSKNKTEQLRFSARNLVRLFDENTDYEIVIQTDEHEKILRDYHLPVTNDNLIAATAFLCHAQFPQMEFWTDDLILCLVATRVFGIPTKKTVLTHDPIYKGYLDLCIPEDNLAEFYQNLSSNYFGLLQNQYIIIRNTDGDVIERRKWDGCSNSALQYKAISNEYMGTVKSRNVQQDLAFDMLQNLEIPIKVLTGMRGSGKDYIMLSHALDMIIKKHKFDKLIWVRNNVEVKDSRPVGFLPGSLEEKLMPFAQVIADHVGGQVGLDYLIKRGQIELQHLGLIRGRDIKSSIIYCSEAENLTKEHIQLLMGRVGEGSALWLNGDFKQVDGCTFEENNGLTTMIERLKGNKDFGIVELAKCERSQVSAMSDLLD